MHQDPAPRAIVQVSVFDELGVSGVGYLFFQKLRKINLIMKKMTQHICLCICVLCKNTYEMNSKLLRCKWMHSKNASCVKALNHKNAPIRSFITHFLNFFFYTVFLNDWDLVLCDPLSLPVAAIVDLSRTVSSLVHIPYCPLQARFENSCCLIPSSVCSSEFFLLLRRGRHVAHKPAWKILVSTAFNGRFYCHMIKKLMLELDVLTDKTKPGSSLLKTVRR